ncbi:MAG: hypothetical protein CEE38_19050 [Planctomycetes bacterium B3_Pla]|nr:MAG: hypothetical protein CEE38_19050 [Planctomycetes bacterium B3_Pla]
MSKISKKLSNRQRIFSVYVPAIAAIVTSLGVLYQVFVPNTPLVISDKSIIEENKRLLAEKESLESKKAILETKLRELENQIAAIKRKGDSQSDKTQPAIDYWIVTALKTIVVYITLIFSAFSTFLTFLGDLFLLLFGFSFVLTKGLWDFAWNKVTIGWYWEQARWYGVLAGILLIMVISLSTEVSKSRN